MKDVFLGEAIDRYRTALEEACKKMLDPSNEFGVEDAILEVKYLAENAGIPQELVDQIRREVLSKLLR